MVDVGTNVCFQILLYLLELLRDVYTGKLAQARGEVEVPKHGETHNPILTSKTGTFVSRNSQSGSPRDILPLCHIQCCQDNIGHLGHE